MSDWMEDERPWQARGKCAEGDQPLSFFFPKYELDPSHDEVRRYCGTCPVRIECFTHSLSWPEHHGSWGGVNQWERARLVESKTPYLCTTCGKGLDPNDVLRNGRELRRCRSCR